MGKVHVGDLLCNGHKLWYRVGCGPGMPGPYRGTEGKVGDSAVVRGRHVCRPYSTNKSIYLVKFLCFLCIYPFDAV